jgi:two-component system, response regulator PdtaR
VTAMRRYLFVDDNLEFAENLVEIMGDCGADCEMAGSGAEAIERVKQDRFDALVTDMRMPEMGGAAVVHEVRRIDPGLPAVVLTAHAGDADLTSARREGLLAVLSKPAPIERLLALLGAARRDGLLAVIEDDTALLDNLTEALRLRGFAAVTASSVLDTERLGPVRPFAALVDLKIPGGPDGEAVRRLEARFPGLPLVAVTASPTLAPLHCRAIFQKPFDTGALLDAVQNLHGERHPPP